MARQSKSVLRVLRQAGIVIAFVIAVTLLMLWLSGKFSPNVPTDVAGRTPPIRAVSSDETTVAARIIRVPIDEQAVGSIRAQHETTIASRILARVVEINLHAEKR